MKTELPFWYHNSIRINFVEQDAYAEENTFVPPYCISLLLPAKSEAQGSWQPRKPQRHRYLRADRK